MTTPTPTTPTPQDWAVTTATERVATDGQGRADVTFTVTNLRPGPARAVLTVATEDDQARSWFTVSDPVRTIDGGASAPFVVKIQVPPDAPASTCAFQATVTSADGASDDSIALSNRVLLTVTPRPTVRRRPRIGPWIVVLVASGLALAVLITAVVLVATRRNGPPPVALDTPTPTPTLGQVVQVPDVIGYTDVEAASALIFEHGLVPVVRYRFDPVGGRVSGQQPRPNEVAAVGDVVAVTFDIAVSAPTDVVVSSRRQVQPLALPYVQPHTRWLLDVTVSWDQVETVVRTWHVMFFSSICSRQEDGPVVTMGPLATGVEVAYMKQVRLTRVHTPNPSLPGVPYNCVGSPDVVYVAPVDDFGNLGPLSQAEVIQP